MGRRKVIKAKYLPTKLPVVGTAFWLFLLHYYNAVGWVWGVVITLLAISWIVILIAVFTQDGVNPSEL
jgi:hypothetical protein